MCVYNTLVNGLRNGINTQRGKAGVYWFAAIDRGCYYHRYQLFPDGTAWCVVWLILADPSMTSSAGVGQQATLQEGVIIIGAYTRGFHFLQS